MVIYRLATEADLNDILDMMYRYYLPWSFTAVADSKITIGT
jgi:hypothetical protein